jgi:hypothetical protein
LGSSAGSHLEIFYDYFPAHCRLRHESLQLKIFTFSAEDIAEHAADVYRSTRLLKPKRIRHRSYGAGGSRAGCIPQYRNVLQPEKPTWIQQSAVTGKLREAAFRTAGECIGYEARFTLQVCFTLFIYATRNVADRRDTSVGVSFAICLADGSRNIWLTTRITGKSHGDIGVHVGYVFDRLLDCVFHWKVRPIAGKFHIQIFLADRNGNDSRELLDNASLGGKETSRFSAVRRLHDVPAPEGKALYEGRGSAVTRAWWHSCRKRRIYRHNNGIRSTVVTKRERSA